MRTASNKLFERDRQCAGCGCHFLKAGRIDAWWDYMVEDRVWAEAGFLKKELACFPCLEKALGRQLMFEDFTKARCNNTIRYVLDREQFMTCQAVGR